MLGSSFNTKHHFNSRALQDGPTGVQVPTKWVSEHFEPFLNPRHSVYRTHRSQSDSMLLEVQCTHCINM